MGTVNYEFSAIKQAKRHLKLAMCVGFSTNGVENQVARPLLALALCDKGEPDFFVCGDFFCSSFVWQTKEEIKNA